jgi:hypothetical protein
LLRPGRAGPGRAWRGPARRSDALVAGCAGGLTCPRSSGHG